MSFDKSQSKEIDDIEFNFPHKYGFLKDLMENTNNFFNASIHCLTNIVTLSTFIINSEQNIDTNNKNSEYKYKDYNLLFNELAEKEEEKKLEECEIIQENQENKEDKIKEKKGKINKLLINLKHYLIDKKNYQYKVDNDPRKLIEFILKDIVELLPNEMKTKIQINCKICKRKKEPNYYLNIVRFDIPEIIQNKKNFNQNNNIIQKDKITIYDCFDYYLNSLNNKNDLNCDCCIDKNIDLSIKELPDIITIFVYYGNDKNICYENSYEFDENINFKNYKFLENNDKEYFLSSIVACKNLGTYFELFYTFARGDEYSKYILYNGLEVRSNLGVKNKLIKTKINLKDKKQSWPFVLIYTNKNLL